MKTDLTILKSDVFTAARKHINYIADKFADDWDKVSWTPENIDFTVVPFTDVFGRVVNLLAEYICYDESAKEYTDDSEIDSDKKEKIIFPLDMPDNWPMSEQTVLKNCIVLCMAHDIVYKWSTTCNMSISQNLQKDLVDDGTRLYDSLCRRMRPRRGIKDMNGLPRLILED